MEENRDQVKEQDKKMINRRELLGLMGAVGVGLAAGSSLLGPTLASGQGNTVTEAVYGDGEDPQIPVNYSTVVTVKDYGAVGDGITDDTLAIQQAINFVSTRGGGIVYFPPGTYKIAQTTGNVPIPVLGGTSSLPYCIEMKAYVILRGESESAVTLLGDYTYGPADLTKKIMFKVKGYRKDPTDKETAYNNGLENLEIKNAFMAYAALDQTLALCRFNNLVFDGCAIAIYSKVLERSHFEEINFKGTGVGVLVGGQWRTSSAGIDEDGGYADKSVFRKITFAYNWELSNGAPIDVFFDTYFFQRWNVAPNVGLDYRGITGSCIVILPRHGRPSNSNTFEDMFIGYTPRYGFYGKHLKSSRFHAINFERVGYCKPKDNSMTSGIGSSLTNKDPYLADDARIPAFIFGADDSCSLSQIQFQQAYCESAVGSPPQRIGLDISTTQGTINKKLLPNKIDLGISAPYEDKIAANGKVEYQFSLPESGVYMCILHASSNKSDINLINQVFVAMYKGAFGVSSPIGGPTYLGNAETASGNSNLVISKPDAAGKITVTLDTTQTKVAFRYWIQYMTSTD